MKYWRKIHIYSFGYWRWLSMISAIVVVIVSLTGILLVHKNDFRFMERVRISTDYLPASYTERLVEIRKQQGTLELFRSEQASIPLSWLIYDLHSGEFFGQYAAYFYDLIALALTVLAITGIYMFFILKPKLNKKRSA